MTRIAEWMIGLQRIACSVGHAGVILLDQGTSRQISSPPSCIRGLSHQILQRMDMPCLHVARQARYAARILLILMQRPAPFAQAAKRIQVLGFGSHPLPRLPVKYGSQPAPTLQVTNSGATSRRSPLKFFALVYALSAPFWVLNVIHPMHLPVDNLPVTDIGATFTPLIAASILLSKEEGPDSVQRLLKRTFDHKRIRQKTWYIPILFLMPALYVLTYGVMRLIGLPVPTEWHPPLLTPLLFIVFFTAAAGEELGYTGYATDPLQLRYTALTASLIMGSIHAVWHYPSMIQMGQTPALMAWGTLLTISFRILTVWLYNNTGNSVFAAILFHAVTNTGRSVFPGGRPAYELGDAAVGYAIITIAAAIVTFLWGSTTLARFRIPPAQRLKAAIHHRIPGGISGFSR